MSAQPRSVLQWSRRRQRSESLSSSACFLFRSRRLVRHEDRAARQAALSLLKLAGVNGIHSDTETFETTASRIEAGGKDEAPADKERIRRERLTWMNIDVTHVLERRRVHPVGVEQDDILAHPGHRTLEVEAS